MASYLEYKKAIHYGIESSKLSIFTPFGSPKESYKAGFKDHICQTRFLTKDSYAAPGQFLPVYAGKMAPSEDKTFTSATYEGRCFKNVSFELKKTSEDTFSIFLTTSGKVSYGCSEWLLFANNTQWKQFSTSKEGTQQIDFKLETEESKVDLDFNGMTAYAFCQDKFASLLSLIETGMAFLDVNEKPRPDLPYFGRQTPISYLTEKATLRAMKQWMGLELEQREIKKVPIDKSLIKSGDTLAILRVWGGAELIMYGTGSPVGHVATAMWFEDGELYVTEADRIAGVMATKWDDWFDWSETIGNNVVWMPLKPELREKFDEQAARDFFYRIESYPYGFASLLFSWYDTEDENLPPILPQSFMPYSMSYAERFFPEEVQVLFTQALNKRLGTDGLTMPEVAVEAAKQGMSTD